MLSNGSKLKYSVSCPSSWTTLSRTFLLTIANTQVKRYSVGSGLAVTGYRCSVIVAGPVACIQPGTGPVAVGGGGPGLGPGIGLGGGPLVRRCEPTHFHWTSTGPSFGKVPRSTTRPATAITENDNEEVIDIISCL